MQTEHVEYKIDGLVLVIEGKSTAADGKVLFDALATIANDDASHAYQFRACNAGHYLDTELSVSTHGSSWSFTAGSGALLEHDADGQGEIEDLACSNH